VDLFRFEGAREKKNRKSPKEKERTGDLGAKRGTKWKRQRKGSRKKGTQSRNRKGERKRSRKGGGGDSEDTRCYLLLARRKKRLSRNRRKGLARAEFFWRGVRQRVLGAKHLKFAFVNDGRGEG